MLEEGPGALDEGPHELGIVLRCASGEERRDRGVQFGRFEPAEQRLRVRVPSEGKLLERRDGGGVADPRLVLPGETGDRELGEVGEARDEVDDVRELVELAVGHAERGHGRVLEAFQVRDALHVDVGEGEGAEGGDACEDVRERSLQCGGFLQHG